MLEISYIRFDICNFFQPRRPVIEKCCKGRRGSKVSAGGTTHRSPCISLLSVVKIKRIIKGNRELNQSLVKLVRFWWACHSLGLAYFFRKQGTMYSLQQGPTGVGSAGRDRITPQPLKPLEIIFAPVVRVWGYLLRLAALSWRGVRSDGRGHNPP